MFYKIEYSRWITARNLRNAMHLSSVFRLESAVCYWIWIRMSKYTRGVYEIYECRVHK